MAKWKSPDRFPEEVADLRSILRSVLGEDTRRPVTVTKNFPESAIAHLIITAADGQVFGVTGAFITPQLVLTSGHNLHIPGNSAVSGRVSKVVVAPGRNGTKLPFGAAQARDYWAHPKWESLRLPDFDWGLVLVPRLARVGSFLLEARADSDLIDLNVAISGYPNDQTTGIQYFDSNTIRSVTPGQVFYSIDTEQGQSGSPVFTFDGQRATIVAVHRFGDLTVNAGTRITERLLADLAIKRAAWKI